jgi:hypothetical protein
MTTENTAELTKAVIRPTTNPVKNIEVYSFFKVQRICNAALLFI